MQARLFAWMGSDAQHIANSLRRFFLCGGGDMGVGIEGESGGEVTQHSADGFDVHAVLQG